MSVRCHMSSQLPTWPKAPMAATPWDATGPPALESLRQGSAAGTSWSNCDKVPRYTSFPFGMNPWPHFTSCSFRASKTDGTRNCITLSAELSHCVAVLRLRSCETGLVHQAVTPSSHGVLLPVVFVSSSVPPVLRDGPCTKQRIPGMYIKIHQTDLTSQEEKGFSCYCNKAHRLTRIQIQNLTLGITEAVVSYSNQILIILSRHQHISVQSEITKLYQVKSQSHPQKHQHSAGCTPLVHIIAQSIYTDPKWPTNSQLRWCNLRAPWPRKLATSDRQALELKVTMSILPSP